MKILRIILGVAATLTLILPIDALPDLVPVLGWIDDVVATLYLTSEAWMAWRRSHSAHIKKNNSTSA